MDRATSRYGLQRVAVVTLKTKARLFAVAGIFIGALGLTVSVFAGGAASIAINAVIYLGTILFAALAWRGPRQ